MKKYDIVDHFKVALAEREKSGEVIVDAGKIAREVFLKCDLSGMTREELEAKYISSLVLTELWKAGYRSVIRGYGFFANERTLRPELIARLFKNQKISRDKAENVLNGIKSHIKNSELSGQLEFDFESGTYKEVMTVEDLLARLAEEAV